MPPYPEDSPLKNWDIRVLVAAACYVEIAIATGCEWGPTRLELIIDGREFDSQSGKYSRMLKGIPPKPVTISQIEPMLPTADILKWRNHPYWKLILDISPSHEDTWNALQTVKGELKKNVWVQGYIDKLADDEKQHYARSEPSLDLIEIVAKHNNFDALLILTAWAREAREMNLLRPHGWLARHTREIFPHVIAHCPHLYIGWPILARLYKKIIWTTPHPEENVPWFDMRWKGLKQEINKKVKEARRNNIQLPPKERFDKVNKNN